MKAAFPFLAGATILQEQPEVLTVQVSGRSDQDEHVKVSFSGTVFMGRVGEPETTEDEVLQVASLDDLMATKVKVVLQRIEVKDYLDIAELIRADVSLAKGLAAARAMYGHDFQPSEALKVMVYFRGRRFAQPPPRRPGDINQGRDRGTRSAVRRYYLSYVEYGSMRKAGKPVSLEMKKLVLSRFFR